MHDDLLEAIRTSNMEAETKAMASMGVTMLKRLDKDVVKLTERISIANDNLDAIHPVFKNMDTGTAFEVLLIKVQYLMKFANVMLGTLVTLTGALVMLVLKLLFPNIF